MLRCAFLFALCALSATFAACGDDPAEPAALDYEIVEAVDGLEAGKADGPNGDRVIGRVVDGRIRIARRTLVQRFPDGGPIEVFRLRRLDDGLHLVRLGELRGGGTQTDVIPLKIVGGRVLVGELKWLTTCFAPECGDHGGFCQVRQSNDGCDCSDGHNCTFGLADEIALYDVVVLGG